MPAKTLRILSIVCLVAAAVVAVMNLKRVADLGMIWLPGVLVVCGAALMIASRKRAVR